jgi:hypothetical protein
MFQPSQDQRLAAIYAMLSTWDREADRFRAAATAALRGETPSSLVVAAVEEAHDGLIGLLDQMDRALAELAPGSSEFAQMLRAQTMALGLLDSIGTSLDRLDRYVALDVAAPRRIAHEPVLTAAE